MKTRIIFAIAALGCLCLLALFAPAIFEHRSRSGTGGPQSGLANTSSPGKFQYRLDEWMGDARTAAALLRYLLETEPPDLNNQLVASNSVKTNPLVQGVSSPRIPLSVRSNLFVSLDGLAVTQLASGNPFTNQPLLLLLPRYPQG